MRPCRGGWVTLIPVTVTWCHAEPASLVFGNCVSVSATAFVPLAAQQAQGCSPDEFFSICEAASTDAVCPRARVAPCLPNPSAVSPGVKWLSGQTVQGVKRALLTGERP